MTPGSFKANPDEWHQSTDLKRMLSLLQHLANDGSMTVALLAADFAERTLQYAGKNKAVVVRCVTAVRTWTHSPTAANLQECKDAADASADAASSAAYAADAAAAAAYAAAAYAAYAAAYADNAADAAANSAAAAAYADNAANAAAHAHAHQSEQQWQLDHVRKKHPLTEL